jgi:photosystem II stability/assembly factor-like uncharacterized protein
VRRLLPVCLVGLVAGSLAAEANRWNRASPPLSPGEPYAAAYSPTGVLWAASGAGLFQSTDGGVTWNGATNLPGCADVRSFAFNGPSTVYVGTLEGLLRSDDGGIHWNNVNYGPGNGEVDAVAAGGGLVYALAGSLYRSADGGESWTACPVSNNLTILSIDPVSASTVYAAGLYGLFKSTDAGGSWIDVTPDLGAIHQVLAVAIDPQHPSVVYAAGAGKVFRSDDAAAHWLSISDSLGSVFVPQVLIDGGSAVYLLTNDYVLVGNDYQWPIYRSQDRGTTWTRTLVPRLNPDLVGAADPTAASTIVVGVFDGLPPEPGGLLKSTDGGQTWNATNAPMTRFYVTDIAFGDRPAVVYALAQPVDPDVRTGPGSLWKTTDGGMTWSPANSNLPLSPSTQVTALASDSSPEPALFAGVGDALFRSTDGSASWSQIGPSIGGPILTIIVDPTDPKTLYASNGGIRKTTDGGLTWSSPQGEEPRVSYSIAVDPIHSANVYATDYSGSLKKSEDGGLSWRDVYSDQDHLVACVATDPEAPFTVYAGTVSALEPDFGPSGKVVKSTDGGATWVDAAGGLPLVNVHWLAAVPGALPALYAATSSGVYRSRDGGATWLPFRTGMMNLPPVWLEGTGSAQKIAFDRATSSTLFVGAFEGAYIVTVDEKEACATDGLRLCLGDRFLVQGTYRNRDSGEQQPALAQPMTADSGLFGFGGYGVLSGLSDVTVKVVDARSVDGGFWAFGGGLSDLDYTIEILDTESGATKTWHHPEGALASYADTSGFSAGALTLSSTPSRQAAGRSTAGRSAVAQPRAEGSSGQCSPSETRTCLQGRFSVEVQWRAPEGELTSARGSDADFEADNAFWFFEPANVDLVVKLVDGRGTNGKFWIFYGSMTTMEFILTVTDTQTGVVRTYYNAPGQLASGADTSAF